MDMVDLDETGRIRQIVIKPDHTHLHYTWIIAVWTPVFTRFMHEYLVTVQMEYAQNNSSSKQQELFVGDVIQAAIHAGLQIETMRFPDGHYVDIGTPEDLVKTVHNNSVTQVA